VGSIIDTSGSVLGNDVQNTGFVELVQTQAITQAAGGGGGAGVYVTNIVVPASSLIVGITIVVSTAWTGVASTLGIGTTASATALTTAAAVDGGTAGYINVDPGTGATQIGNWLDVGTPDIQIKVTSTNTGSGAGTLIVRYIQTVNTTS
tara:strand:+ start:1415 stop:1861 length:447 start_codon:yes stop_codon:yes gene_type:complete